jgi:hypothetical protein
LLLVLVGDGAAVVFDRKKDVAKVIRFSIPRKGGELELP